MGSGVTRRTDWIGHLLFGLVGLALGALLTASHRPAAEAAVPEAAPAATAPSAPSPTPERPTPRPAAVADQPESLSVSGDGVPAELAVGQTRSSDDFSFQMHNALTVWLDDPSTPIAMQMFDNMPARYDGQVDAQDLQSLGAATAVRRHLVDLQQWTLEHQTAPARILVRAEVIGCYDFDEKALGTSECRVTNPEEWLRAGTDGMLVNALLYWAEVEDDSGLPLDSRTLVGKPSGLDNGWDRHRPERKVNRRWVDLAVYDVTPRKIRRRPEVMPAEMDGHSPNALISKLPIEVAGWDWQVKLRGSSTGLGSGTVPYEIHLPVVDPPSVMLDAIVHHQTEARSER